MTGYGRGQSTFDGARFSVELNSVNRKQSDITVSLPREISELESRVRDLINARISRGRLNVIVSYQSGAALAPRLAIDSALAAAYYRAMLELRDQLGALRPSKSAIDNADGRPPRSGGASCVN